MTRPKNSRRPKPGRTQWVTVNDILDELDIPRRTWQRWRRLGRTPKPMTRLPNGEYRIRRPVYEAWLAELEVEA